MLWLLLIPLLPSAALLLLWIVGERGHLILPSTRRAISQSNSDGRRRGILAAIHGYVYGRWTFQYIKFCIDSLVPKMTPRLKLWWADHYHGKVLTTELACEIVKLDHDIKRTDLEQIIPYRKARDIVLRGSPPVTLLECPCRHARENPCSPTQVCMVVGGGDFVLEHHPGKSRRVNQQEALGLLRAEHDRGHVHTAYFKDACNDRFYAICNCCSCCCGGLEAMVKHGVPMVTSSGYVAEVDETACIACGDCEDSCPFEAITVNGKSTVDWERCMGCGVCEGRCELDAIGLILDRRKGLPLDVRHMAVPAGTD
ncbi:MAG: 4Fe-4S binding protein [Gemmatimonadota bacterium]|nr:MAG: 4Fe-4S binding protein [Gemmatimonadota bacterium]